MQKAISDAYIAIKIEIQKLQSRIEGIDANLKRLSEGRSPIDDGTRNLMAALKAAGIAAEPICDLVEVTDEKWRMAAEAALGRSREALIVDPSLSARALEIYRRGDDTFAFAEVVNTTKTGQTRPADKGSLAMVVSTQNAHARAFIDFRLGRLAMVETVEKLLAVESAITPDRMMQSGRSVKRLARPVYLKLGRSAADQARKLLEDDRSQCVKELGDKVHTANRLNEDKILVDDVARALEALRASGVTCALTAGAISECDRKIVELSKAIEDAKRKRDPKLVREQTSLKADQTLAKNAKSKANGELDAAQVAQNEAGGWLKRQQNDLPEVRSVRCLAARMLPADPAMRQPVQAFHALARAHKTEGLPGEIASRKADVQHRVDKRRPELQRELTGALSKYREDFRATLPFTYDQADAQIVGPWAAGEKQRLDTHELIKYEEQSRTAEGEMTVAFRDDLLHQLHDAFEGIKGTLNELNRHLSGREFHGRDYYRFKAAETGTHADLIELVRQSRRPDFQFSLFGKDDGDAADNAVMRAKRRIETILSNREAKTEEIEDPRQYFNFELFIHDKDGKVRSSLSSRAGTGSGGEGQLPFYIAIGASLAATYQNKRTKEMGLALAIFDEAFNRLDTTAICACSDFLKDLGLQVVLAAPDEKRHVFMEVVDTVVNVTRSRNDVLVDVEYLSDKTRKELSEADPYRKGFEKFKAELMAISDEAERQQQAAE